MLPSPDVGQLESFKGAKFFFEGEEIGERLARVKFVRERVDDRNRNVGSHLFENALLVDASDDALHPLLEVARDIRNGFAFAEAGLRVVQEDHEAAHALDADFKSDTRAQGRLLKNQRDVLIAQDRGKTRRTRLDFRGALQEVARSCRTPLGAGEKILCQWDSERCSRSSHSFFLPKTKN